MPFFSFAGIQPETIIFSKEILHLQQVQRGQQVQGYRAHHGLQMGPHLHEHPEVRHLPG